MIEVYNFILEICFIQLFHELQLKDSNNCDFKKLLETSSYIYNTLCKLFFLQTFFILIRLDYNFITIVRY
jgi:hypothetical protein